MYQSKRIIEQAMRQIPAGPVCIDDHRYIPPPKERVYNSIEGLMNHASRSSWKASAPPQGAREGEVYQAVEGGNGELGFYVISDGSGRPYRVRVRPPCFFGMAALNKMLIGRMIADIITTFPWR